MDQDFYRFVPESLDDTGERFANRFKSLALGAALHIAVRDIQELKLLNPVDALAIDIILSARVLVDPKSHRLPSALTDLFAPILAELKEVDTTLAKAQLLRAVTFADELEVEPGQTVPQSATRLPTRRSIIVPILLPLRVAECGEPHTF